MYPVEPPAFKNLVGAVALHEQSIVCTKDMCIHVWYMDQKLHTCTVQCA